MAKLANREKFVTIGLCDQ